MVSIWEVLELLRVYGRLTTKDIAEYLGVTNNKVTKQLHTLRFNGYARIVGKRRTENNRLTNIWELTDKAWKVLEKNGVRSFYDLPFVKKHEELYYLKTNRRFRRWT